MDARDQLSSLEPESPRSLAPRHRFEALGAKVDDLRLETALTWAGIVLFGIPLLFTCPFLWAYGAYQYLKGRARGHTPGQALVGTSSAFVEAHGDRVSIFSHPAHVIHAADVLDGWLETDEHGSTYVVCRLRNGRRLAMHLREPADAEEVLATLGVDVSQAVARYPLASNAVESGQGPVYHLLGPAFAAMVVFGVGASGVTALLRGGPILPSLLVLAVVAAVMAVFAHSVRPGRVVVGMDGFRVRRGLRERFYSYADVHRVIHEGDHVRVWVGDDSLDLSCATFASDEPERTHSLGERLARAHTIYQARRGDGAAAISLLERGDRTLAAWRADLEALSVEKGGYRRVHIDDAVLTEVVEDATAPAEQRLGAAIVLAARKAPPEVAERVRIATKSCANPKLRIALDHVLDGDALAEAELEAALTLEAQA